MSVMLVDGKLVLMDHESGERQFTWMNIPRTSWRYWHYRTLIWWSEITHWGWHLKTCIKMRRWKLATGILCSLIGLMKYSRIYKWFGFSDLIYRDPDIPVPDSNVEIVVMEIKEP